jgi:signal transduction histidine kinase
MKRLAEELIEYASVEGGALRLDRRSHELGSIVDDALELLLEQAERRGVALAVRGAAAPLELDCDRHRVVRVLVNLVGNAIKYTSAGGSVTVETHARDGVVEIDVIDSGAGIGEAELPHVFDRFWQSEHDRRGGVGLGLFVARAIVEAHSGSLSVTSQVGHGSRFAVTLPCAYIRRSDES